MSATPVTVEEALRYDLVSLEVALNKCEDSIKIFEDAIKNERETQARYREMITIIKVHKGDKK